MPILRSAIFSLHDQIGITARQKNAMTAGAYVVDSLKIKTMDGEGMDVEVTVKTRSFFGKVRRFRDGGCHLPVQLHNPFDECVLPAVSKFGLDQSVSRT